MPERGRTSILSYLHHITAETGGVSDAQLLDRFVAGGDEAAFELIVWRHARLVFGVCRRVLHDVHDAEDAFQATFLALARHASRIAKREAVAGWLHQVAYRTALTARDQRARHGTREQHMDTADHLAAPPDAEAAAENHELRRVLDEEIGRLPERFRTAVILCYLEGKSVEEAAVLLGCPRGTVASRLARARQRLRVRLTKRGLALTAAIALLTQANAAPRPLALIPSLIAAAMRYSARGTAADGVLSSRITALTDEVLRTMFIHKIRNIFFVLTAFAGILLAGSGLARGLRANRQPETEPPNKEKVADAPRPVTVSRPVQREAAPYQVYTGRLEAHRAVEIRPAMSGFVVKVCFKAGAAVKKGDVLFELDSRSARLTVEKAEAALEGANALAAKRRAEENRWDSEVERLRREVKKGVVDPQVLRESEQQQQISAFARVAAEAAVKAAKIDVARARLELEATTVTAPLSGHAGRPLVEAGTLVFRGPDRATLLTTITVLDPINVVFDIDERSYLDYQRLLREKKVKGTGNSLRFQLAGEKGFTHEGTLEWIEGVNPLSSAHVRGNIPNADRILRPGMFVRVRMTLGPPRPVLEVPEEAILSDQGKKYVLVVNERNIAERRAVTLGPADNGKRIIEKGLKADDWMVIAGFAGLHPGDLVAPNKKAAPKRPDSDSPKH